MIRAKPPISRSDGIKVADQTSNFFRITMASMLKRSFDFIAALIGLFILSPFFIVIAVLIKKDSPGPVFYWGPRIGWHGKIFRMLKFRTMYDTPKSFRGARITAKDDDRITKLGKWLRETKLNELPQLWNVLIGEMSLVGPRPEDPDISKTWPLKIAEEILSVRPGVTSPASIVYRNEENMLNASEVMRKYLHVLSPDKMRLDQLYVRYRSFLLDLDVILWTALLLIPKIKKYSPPEQFLFVGPLTRLIRRYVSWLILDFIVVFISIRITNSVISLFLPINIDWISESKIALGFAVLYNLIGIILQTNRINWTKAPTWETGRLWVNWLFTAIIIPIFFYYYLDYKNLSIYSVIFGSAILSLIGIILVRYRGQLFNSIARRLLASPRLVEQATLERVLIVGSGRTAEHIAWLMDHPTYSGKFKIVGFIDDDFNSQGMKIYGAKVIGSVSDIPNMIKKHDIGLIILADNQMASGKYKEFRNTAIFSPARIVVAPDIFGSLSSLNGNLADINANDNLNDFQCQNCLARFSARQGD
jgi:lipopolysaccharide/colanic/teichoic acid biosynthesis glycosyltransferase